MDEVTRAEAARLSGLWGRLSAQHIALGCSCLMGGVSVRLEDFELDIADWLWAESERLGETAVTAFLLAPGPINTQDKAVRLILARVEAGEADPASAQWLLTRMTRTIESYARLHGPAPEAPLMGGARAWRGGYRD
ncbi:MAG: hypothetical protein Q7K57_60010 [Burkholderiaceae bacterium]|nr:hypothetical protein [Burkholderiaceae bacterium]